jgi:hypothetical protein
MCTNIAAKTRVSGSAKMGDRWAKIDDATIGFDHATHAWVDHALRLDFYSKDAAESVAIEIDLESGKALLRELAEVIAAAEASGVEA